MKYHLCFSYCVATNKGNQFDVHALKQPLKTLKKLPLTEY